MNQLQHFLLFIDIFFFTIRKIESSSVNTIILKDYLMYIAYTCNACNFLANLFSRKRTLYTYMNSQGIKIISPAIE